MTAIFTASSRCEDRTGWRSVQLALLDLARDFRNLLPDGTGCPVRVRLEADPAHPTLPEHYKLKITGAGAEIVAADELGAIYGVYRFSHEFLGVEPLWFWKDSYPEAQFEPLRLTERTISSVPARFARRGWFINDEDLLTGWQESGGERHIDYPFYQTVIAPGTAQAIYEAALRSGANLIIPASFLDITNPPEAKLIELAVERGLYVSQHHIEPLGVSHFTFRNYWKRQGQTVEFAFGSEPEKVCRCWRHFVGEWYRIAGDKVIWQLGLRGNGDLAIWNSDASVSRKDAGTFITRALREQIAIIRETDPRPLPPMTLTLWAEMSGLMAQGEFILPPEIIPVFSDFGHSQEMQDDFLDISRESLGDRRGVYFHVAYWICGAHLHPGTSPLQVERIFREVIQRGDTAYAIINVSNIREHVIGVESAMAMMLAPETFDAGRFLKKFAGDYDTLFLEYFRSFHIVFKMFSVQDGDIALVAQQSAEYLGPEGEENLRNFSRLMRACAERFAAVAAAVPDRAPEFIRLYLATHSRQMAALYRFAAALTDGDKPEALRQLDRYLADRPIMEQGKWATWYRGDRKAAWPDKRLRLAESIARDAKEKNA